MNKGKSTAYYFFSSICNCQLSSIGFTHPTHATLALRVSTIITMIMLLCHDLVAQSPIVTDITPQHYSYNVAPSTNIVVTFNQNIDVSSVIDAHVIVRGSQSNRVSGTLSGGGTSTITFTPDQDFRLGESVSITLTEGLTSPLGLPLPRGYTFTFTIATGPPPSTPIALAQRNIYEVSQPENVEVLDFDNDGDLDIMTGNEGFSESTFFYENDGNQNFCPSLIANFRNVEVHDLDGDGDLDAFGFTGAFDTEINWFENEGTTPFTERFISPVDPWTLTGGDLDSDGDIDLLAATLIPDAVRWFANDGSGNFSPLPLIPSTFGGGSNSFFEIVDINADGAMDILAFHERDSLDLVWYENDGSENFTEVFIGRSPNRQRFAVADLDLDGDVDILATSTLNNAAAITWYNNTGNEVFAAQDIPLTLPSANTLQDIRVTDLDGDLDLDILAGSYWFDNDGNQVFTQRLMTDSLSSGVVINARAIDFADIEGDGDMDVVTLDFGLLSWQENGLFMDVVSNAPVNASGSVSSNSNIIVEFSEVIDGSTIDQNTFSVRDMYGDRISGIYTGGGSNTITFNPDDDFRAGTRIYVSISERLLSESGHNLAKTYGFEFTVVQETSGDMTWVSNSIIVHSDNATGLAIGDIDGDGNLDVLSSSFTELYWHQNDGDGVFISNPIDITVAPTGLLAIDENEDGSTDILIDNSGITRILTNDGNQSFSDADFLGASNPLGGRDMDHDGDLDIYGLNGRVSWSNNTCNIYQGSSRVVNITKTSVLPGDIDNDGDMDFLATGSTGANYIPNGNFTNYQFFPVEITTTSCVNQELADLDQDGDLDLIIVEGSAGLTWYENRLLEGTNDFGDRQAIGSLNQGPRAVKAADLDGDGDLDLVAISRNDDRVVWYENRLNETSADFSVEQTIGITADGPIRLEVADIDNDGDIDIVTLSDGDDELIWFENNFDVCTPPSIQVQPQSQEVEVGEDVTIVVTADGTSLSYQWQKDGIDIDGQTASDLIIENVSAQDAGNYTCLISNACGSITSSIATLTLCTPPTIQVQPQSQVISVGEDATFSITADGTSLSYQWQKDGVDIGSQTSTSLILETVSAQDAGDYVCIVSNTCGTATSLVATLTVNAAASEFSINDQSANQEVTDQSQVEFGITEVGETISRTFTIENTGGVTMNINSIQAPESIVFDVTGIPQQILAGESASFQVSAFSETPGEFTADIFIESDIGNFSFRVIIEFTEMNGELIVYNAVAPNGNGKNEFFKIENIESAGSNTVEIFNRWGDKVYEVQGYNNQDVRFEGVGNVGSNGELVEGTYFYLIRTDNEELTGFIFLRR